MSMYNFTYVFNKLLTNMKICNFLIDVVTHDRILLNIYEFCDVKLLYAWNNVIKKNS